MRISARYFIIGVALLGVAGVFYFKTHHIVAAEHERFDRSLERMRRLDSVFNQDLLKARFHLLEDYDSFGEQVLEIRKLLGDLKAIPGFVDNSGRETISRKINELSQLQAEKIELLETFKSQNAVLRNSLQYFPLAGSELVKRLNAAGDHRELEIPFNELMLQALAYSLVPSGEQEQEIRTTLARIDDWRAAHPDDAEAGLVGSLNAHARAILNRQPRVEALVRQLVSLPTSQCAEEVLRLYEAQFARAVQSAELYRGFLYALCLVLVAGIGYTIYALRAANAHLERRARESLQAEERIRASLNEVNNLKTALDEHAIVAITNPQGTINYVNDKFCAISKYSREELLGQDHRLINSGNHPKAFIRGLWATIGRGHVWKAEMCNRAKGGSLYWVDTTIVPFLDARGKPVQYVVIRADITERKQAEANLEKVNRELIETSRQAGMAEVATSVLHNVGNVLNSVNTSASMVTNCLKTSKADGVSRVVELLEGNRGNLAQFLSTAGRLDQVINFLKSLDQRLAFERKTALNELQELNKNIEHIKEIVVMQQSYARISGVTEKVKPTDLVEDALRMNAGALDRHGVQLVREYDPELPEIIVEKHKVLQILVNLIRNAKYACDEAGLENKCMTVRVANGDKHVRISVTDNGVGIPAENLERIFNHGFTTREHGHGFGLHSGALAAKELGGSLVVRSDGPGKGATFTLELPVLPGAGSGARGSLPRPHGAREGWREGDTIASRSEALATIAPTPQPALAHSEAHSGEPSPCVTP